MKSEHKMGIINYRNYSGYSLKKSLYLLYMHITVCKHSARIFHEALEQKQSYTPKF